MAGQGVSTHVGPAVEVQVPPSWHVLTTEPTVLAVEQVRVQVPPTATVLPAPSGEQLLVYATNGSKLVLEGRAAQGMAVQVRESSVPGLPFRVHVPLEHINVTDPV